VSIAQICNYKQALIARLIDPNALPTRKWLAEWNKRMDFQDRQYAMHDKIMAVHPGPDAANEDDRAKTFNRLLCEFWRERDAHEAFIAALPDIMRAARYERRARSRRRRAFFEFMALKALSS